MNDKIKQQNSFMFELAEEIGTLWISKVGEHDEPFKIYIDSLDDLIQGLEQIKKGIHNDSG